MDRERPIDSMRELRLLVPAILKKINADQSLALRAAANPLLALDELGYRLTPPLRAEAERLVRFPKSTRERLELLEKDIFKLAGAPFDLASQTAVDYVLFDQLKLPRPEAAAAQHQRAEAGREAAAIGSQLHFARDFVDPLEPLAGKHPIMAPLLEHRRLDAGEPRLAPVELYERIRRGEVRLPVVRIRARLKKDAAAP